ncbi:hypothetical protein CBS101457_005173 [Exobasidium rhododendri]|nr:hypothetical protein CBS101457_005173 [Exobasidium rhododendri]
MADYTLAKKQANICTRRIRSSSSSSSSYYQTLADCKLASAQSPLDYRHFEVSQRDMAAGFSESGREAAESDDGGNWSTFSSQVSWTGDEMIGQQHQSFSQQQQQQQQHPDQSQFLSHSLQSSPQQQQQENLPFYSTSFGQNYQAVQSLPNPRRYTIQSGDVPSSQGGQFGRSSYGVSEGYAAYAQSPTTVSAATIPQQPLQTTSDECFCAIVGQPCNCPRPRPRLQQQYYPERSNAIPVTNERGASSSGSSVQQLFPVALHHPNATRKRASTQHLSLEAASLAMNWATNQKTPSPSFFFDEGATPTSAHPDTSIQTQQNRLMNQSHALTTASQRESPHLSFASNHPSMQAQAATAIPYPGLSYLYESLPSPNTTAAAQYANSRYPDAGTNLMGSRSDSLMGSRSDSLMGPRSDSLMQQTSSLSDIKHPDLYRQQQDHDPSMSHWLSRPSTSGSAYSIDNSISQLSLSSASRNPSTLYGQRASAEASTSLITGLAGFSHDHSLSDTTPSIASSTFSKPTTAEESDTSSSVGVMTQQPLHPRYATDEQRWNAIVQRSHSADNHFVYGALTTRIYCRPSCASKRPDRNRVVFYQFPDASVKAEYAGFRACKRCKPGTPGTADLCVLAVGRCLQHITRAALLGESEEVDSKLKKKTLKEYSSDYGVSAFHFHRTLKNVCTLTPGDYSKACHALVLQDEIGMDKKNGQPLEGEELRAKLRGWSSRRARRAVGNILPTTYSNGFPNMKMYYVEVPGTSFGNVAVLYSKGEELNSLDMVAHPLDTDAYSNAHLTVFATLIGEDALLRIQRRAPGAVRMSDQSAWLRSLVEDLARKGLREIQMPQEVIPWVRRARVYLAVKSAMEPKSQSVGGGKRRSNNSDGDDEDEDDVDEEYREEEEEGPSIEGEPPPPQQQRLSAYIKTEQYDGRPS